MDILNGEKTKMINIQCQFCPRSFTTSEGVLSHIKKNHEDERKRLEEQTNEPMKFKCPLCDLSCRYLGAHMKAKHPEAVRANKICDVCNKYQPGSMKEHRGLCIICPYCGKEKGKQGKKYCMVEHLEICKSRFLSASQQPLDLSTTPQKSETSHEKN